MDVMRVLHMVGGAGDTSYASNSSLQKIAISKARSMVEDSILNLYGTSIPESLNIADLGCSSGPNTLLVIKEIIDVTHERCSQLQRSMPELRLFLNDLPGNDFNTIFMSLPAFYDTLKEEKGLPLGTCFIAGVPGSFYGRLFPINFLDFVHSSYSVHWLSQVPQGLQSDMGLPLNKGNIYMAKSSPPAVFKAYLDQFQSDLSLFLNLRSEEMTCGGRMVLTLMGRKGEEPSSGDCCHLWELLAQALKGMVSQGVIKEAKLDSFDLPYYTPSVKELKAVIAMEGSFVLDQLQITEINWDTNDNDDSEYYFFDKKASGQNVAKCIRAVTESLLANHFGAEIIDELFEKYAENVGEHLAKEKTKHVNIIFSMTKKV
ncbi:SABATH methyltransferase 22 [Cinnamomum micranthum f. kanehirae]|uniref:SABATH methyltransferase 22 n=1 Tax=Cinnamomum micranthum f. kanehirae TaxID=337451 RepID=A0A3S3PA03_9MAGN|nr:SABATH methyltransferase 22 [Cinnamomum micranthum f. kanehirae]